MRWYLRYALSYRDLEVMMRERGLSLDLTTIYRWVQAYAPELEKRIRPLRVESLRDCRIDRSASRTFYVFIHFLQHNRLARVPGSVWNLPV
jgi:transposase-like protein